LTVQIHEPVHLTVPSHSENSICLLFFREYFSPSSYYIGYKTPRCGWQGRKQNVNDSS